ncbi:hypothetical protein DENSPDRAFT_834514 [Dentipellis sp. KUC8613]|nr:hypothetical protein DENSPDRAFT_834514 [Dentipellis sp. KUC8613]
MSNIELQRSVFRVLFCGFCVVCSTISIFDSVIQMARATYIHATRLMFEFQTPSCRRPLRLGIRTQSTMTLTYASAVAPHF